MKKKGKLTPVSFRRGMRPAGRGAVLYEMPRFAFLNLRHEAVSPR